MPASLDGLSRLPDDVFVIDPVIHALNLDRTNIASRYGEQLWQMSHGLHCLLTPPDRHVPAGVYLADMAPNILVRTMFEETQTSLAATHTLTLDSWFRDGFAAEWKTVAMARDYATRVLAYVGVDPCAGLNVAMASLERQVADTPNAIGLKLYPHQIDPYRRWYANDDVVMRLIERAAELGLRTIAIHKALPNGSVPLDSYRIGEDFEQAADAFPGMTFEIIHAGMAFIEETAMAVGRFPNVYANLETTTAMLWQAPGRFAQGARHAYAVGRAGEDYLVDGVHRDPPAASAGAVLGDAVRRTHDGGVRGAAARRADQARYPGRQLRARVGLDVDEWRARQVGDAFAGRAELAATVERVDRPRVTRAGFNDAVRAVLGRIHDPCSVAAGRPMSVIDMGLVLGWRLDADGVLAVEFCVTWGGCTMAPHFLSAAERDLAGLPGVTRVKARVDPDHVWDERALKRG